MAPAGLERPAVPEQRDRPHRLDMAEFEATAVVPDVGFDQVGAERFDTLRHVWFVAAAVGDDEWAHRRQAWVRRSLQP
jgi:hypothetical protein